MFKLQLQWMKKGQWIDCVYPPAPYEVSMSRFHYYTDLHGEDHNYRILSLGLEAMAQDTPMAEAYGG